MSSNIPPNSPPIPVENGACPPTMWMPYGFVQFDGNFNNNPGSNQIAQPQGMSPYGGVIFQQPLQSPQLQNDPNRQNAAMIPSYPLISSPPPPANFPNPGNSVINQNPVSSPLMSPIPAVPESVMFIDQNSAPTRNTIHLPDNAALRDSQLMSRNSMISSPQLARQLSPPPVDASGQQLQPVFQPMLVGWQPVQQPGLNPNQQHANQASQQGIPDVIGYQQQIPNAPPMNISHNEFQHFPPDVVPGQQDLSSYVNESENKLEQPTYSNDGAARAQSVQPTTSQEEPTYMNETSEDSKRSSRGLSLPPVISQPGQSPVAPPRSRRGSQRGSMVSLNNLSTQSLDAIGLSDRLKGMIEEEKNSANGEKKKLNLPKRPPRKKDFLRKAVLGQSLPRSFKSLSIICEDLPQYDVPSPPAEEASTMESNCNVGISNGIKKQDGSDQNILTIPGSQNKGITENRDLQNKQLVEGTEKIQPVIAQPGTTLRNHPVGKSNSADFRLSVPMPGSNIKINTSDNIGSISKSLSSHDVPRDKSKPERNSIHTAHIDLVKIEEIQNTVKPVIAQPTGDNKEGELKLPHLSKPLSSPLQQRSVISPQIIVEDTEPPSEPPSITTKETKQEITKKISDINSDISTESKTNETNSIPQVEYQNAPMADYQNVDNEKMGQTYLYSMPPPDGGNMPDLSTLLSKSPVIAKKGASHGKISSPKVDKKLQEEEKIKKSTPKKIRKKHSSESSGPSKSPRNDNSKQNRESIYASPKRDSRTIKTPESSMTRKENPYETVEYTNAVMEFDKLVAVTPQNYKSSVSDDEDEEFEPVEAPENDQELFRKHLNNEFRKTFYGINPETNDQNEDIVRNDGSGKMTMSSNNDEVDEYDENREPNDNTRNPNITDLDDSEEEDETSESETETLDVTLDMDNDHETVDDFFDKDRHTDKLSGKKSNRTSNLGDDEEDIEYNDMEHLGANFSWDDVDGAGEGMPPALLLHSRLR